jgi:hypothetical protein
MKSVLKGTANTAENLAADTGKTAGNLASNVGNTTGNLASNLGNTAGNLASNVGNTAGNLASNVGNTAGGLGSNYGTSGLGSNYGTSGLGSNYGTSGLGSNYGTTGGLGSYGSSGIRTSGTLSGGTWVSPTVVTEHVEKPVIIKEKVLPQEKIEVQPIIHREREQLEVHEVIQPMHEKDIAPTLVKHATLPAQVRPDIRESDTQFQSMYKEATTRYVPEIQTQPVAREFFNKAPIVEEHISKKIVEEVQPVLYKETITPVLIEETQPIFERVVEAPTIVEEIRQPVDLGTKVQPLSGQMENLSLNQPSLNQPLGLNQQPLGLNQPLGFQRETYVTKEFIPAQDFQKVERTTTTDTKRIV